MANKIFNEILEEEIEIFRNSFTKVSNRIFINDTDNRLFHSGEFGMYREAIVKKFLKFFIPPKLEIDQGFLINSFDEVSNQCDIVIYDRNYTPLLRSNELQRFYPVETVCAVGEVKSVIDFKTLQEAVLKLYNTKKISEKVASESIIKIHKNRTYNSKEHPEDLITTFIVCQKLNFDLNRITSLYPPELDPRFMHNMILSLEDGLILYSGNYESDISGMHAIPTINGIKQNDTIYSFESGGIDCFKIFCNLIFNATTFRTVMLPEILSYMKYPSN